MDERMIKRMTDGQLLFLQRQLLRLSALGALASRYGYSQLNRWGDGINDHLREVENEYLSRHPERRDARFQEFLRAADQQIAEYNRERIGDRDDSGRPIDVFVEYNKPNRGEKTIHRGYAGGGVASSTAAMDEADRLYASLEDVLNTL